MSFLIFALTVKFHPPHFVDVVLFPFHFFWHLWLQGVGAAERNFYILDNDVKGGGGRGGRVGGMNRLLISVCFR